MSSDICFCVVGLGKSGYSAAKLLLRRKYRVKITESQETSSLRRRASYFRKLGAEVEIGTHSPEFYQGASIYVLSPGVAKENPVVRYSRRENLPLISEIELAWWFSPAKVIAITGTNGKTSISVFTYKLLKKAGIPVHLAGNVGTPFSEIALDLSSQDVVVLEVSSFQLEEICYFRPGIAVLTNLAEDHLDRYKDFEDYINAKFNIFKNQSSDDLAVIDLNQDWIRRRKNQISARLVDVSRLQLPELNVNKKFVYAIAKEFGLEDNFLISELRRLKSLKHRLEELGSLNGVRFINDSKATNPHATKWALQNIDSEVILIAGGREKNTDFSLIKEEVAEKVKALILLGEAKEKILSALGGFVEVVKLTSTLEEAVRLSLQNASAGDTILFSPMCASFDMFENYQARGNAFKRIVRELQKCGS